MVRSIIKLSFKASKFWQVNTLSYSKNNFVNLKNSWKSDYAKLKYSQLANVSSMSFCR